jgi:hypothetical protein
MTTSTTEFPPEFAGFHENARAKRLAFPFCRPCGRFHWYPMPRCPACRGREIEWRPVSGKAEVFSFTRVQHPFDKARTEALPYIVALLAFADAPGVRFVTNIVGDRLDEVKIGQAVEARFTADRNGEPLVVFSVA